ncbi:putative nuclease HARBI1 [Solenopsis invicta]|uniref:putative nuclease HARBI1 n=1 Tax=Solenopsis invicta TaxID=13686 RepID=UPI00193CA764|nr:putative nuclease HARBI1 [Solenopsis invicta]
MNVEIYQDLLNSVGPLIAKQNCVRISIPANTRLEICLRYLASGDSMKSLSYAYRVGHNTISKIISETCNAIWTLLKDKVFPSYCEDTWKKIANEFENRWNFHNCIGALDGKHVMIQAPPHSGSTYYNYKLFHSLVLLAVCDAEYCFTFLDIGAEGRQSDGGVFRNSNLYKALEENLIRIPPPDVIGNNGPVLPYT